MTLADVCNPDGTQRFYPPYQHPGTARWRAELAKMEQYKRLAEQNGLSEAEANAAEAIGYIKEQLARFEWGEDRAKREWLERERG